MAKHPRLGQGPIPVPSSSPPSVVEATPTQPPVELVVKPGAGNEAALGRTHLEDKLPEQPALLPEQLALPPELTPQPQAVVKPDDDEEDEEEEDDNFDNVQQGAVLDEVPEVAQNDPRRSIRKQLRHLYHLPGAKPLPDPRGPLVTHARNLKNA